MKDSILGQKLDEYLLENMLGQGNMARVYKALDTRLKRYVALKVIDKPHRSDSEYVMRFEREAQAIGQLDHPNIVSLYRYGESQGILYMAMQYVEGTDLGTILAQYRREQKFVKLEDVSRFIRQVCEALDYAHTQGVIHRDVKPGNIMLDRLGNAIVTDFGLALMEDVGTRGEIFGTPHYLAPEQAVSSAKVVPASDQYSIGVTMYEIFTGQLPFDAPKPLDVAMMHINNTPTPPRQVRPNMPAELEGVILKAMAKDPKERYVNCTALADALEQALEPYLSKTKGSPVAGGGDNTALVKQMEALSRQVEVLNRQLLAQQQATIELKRALQTVVDWVNARP